MDAAIQLFLVNPSASMSDVALKAGIGRATLYRHFDTRQTLILALATESLQKTDEVLQPLRENNLSAYDLLCEGLRAIMPLADRFYFLVSLWSVCDEDDTEAMAIYNRQLGQLQSIVERAKREKSIDNTIPTSWIVSLIDSLIYVGWWSVSMGDTTAQQAADLAIKSLFNGVGVRQPTTSADLKN